MIELERPGAKRTNEAISFIFALAVAERPGIREAVENAVFVGIDESEAKAAIVRLANYEFINIAPDGHIENVLIPE